MTTGLKPDDWDFYPPLNKVAYIVCVLVACLGTVATCVAWLWL